TGAGRGAGAGRGGPAGAGARGGNPANTNELPAEVAAANPQAPAPATPPQALATIGPDGPNGNVLYAWDPFARRERWRAPGGAAPSPRPAHLLALALDGKAPLPGSPSN